MAFSLLGNKKEKTLLLIDISSGSVAGALVKYVSGTVPTVLSAERVTIPRSGRFNAEEIAKNIPASLAEVLKVLPRTKNMLPDAASIMFSAPWTVSRTKHIDVALEKTFIITEKFIQTIIDSEEKQFEHELLDTPDAHGNITANITANITGVIEKSYFDTRLNGYGASDPIGKRTKNFSLSVYVACAQVESIQSAAAQVLSHTHLPAKRIETHTMPFVAYHSLRTVVSVSSDYLFMDVTEERTELSLIQGDVLVKTVSFPSGTEFVIRELVKVQDVSPEIAASSLSLYLEEKSDPALSVKVQTSLENVEKEWAIYFSDTLASFSPAMPIPSRIIISAPAPFSRLYDSFIKKFNADEGLSRKINLETIVVGREMLEHHCSMDANHVFDTRLALLAVFHGIHSLHA